MSDVDAIEIVESSEVSIIEITDAGITPGPAGKSGLVDVYYGTGPEPNPAGLKEGSLYIRYV